MSEFPVFSLDSCAFAYGNPVPSVLFKQQPEDFRVTEQLSFELENKGTHAYLFVEKKQLNTIWLAEQLARYACVPKVQIGYAGLKDKHAISRQWFSVNLEGIREPDWDLLNIDGVRILKKHYHPRKLKKGTIKSNHFQICLRNVSPDDFKLIDKKLDLIRHQGFPNYFGQQRFGIKQQNLNKARLWLSGQLKMKSSVKKSLYLSSARSMLFNAALSYRIEQTGWNQLINGEVFMLSGSHSRFLQEQINPIIVERVKHGDIHPTAMLWGKGDLSSSGALLELEIKAIEKYRDWCEALEAKGLKQDRRAIRVVPENLQWNYQAQRQMLELNFYLPSGSYATALMREIGHLIQDHNPVN